MTKNVNQLKQRFSSKTNHIHTQKTLHYRRFDRLNEVLFVAFSSAFRRAFQTCIPASYQNIFLFIARIFPVYGLCPWQSMRYRSRKWEVKSCKFLKISPLSHTHFDRLNVAHFDELSVALFAQYNSRNCIKSLTLSTSH